MQHGAKRSEVEMDREIEIEEDVQGAKEEVYKRTSVGCIRFRQKNKNGSRCIGLCYRYC